MRRYGDRVNSDARGQFEEARQRALIDPELFHQFILQDDVWTFEVTVTNPLGQKLTYTGCR